MIDENDAADAEGDSEETAADSAGDKVGKKYRERYGKTGHTGDEIAEVLKAHCVDKDGKIDTAKLDKLCSANGIEYGKYEHLNVGMQRMTIGNILRGKHRKGEAIKIGTTKIAGAEQDKEAA